MLSRRTFATGLVASIAASAVPRVRPAHGEGWQPFTWTPFDEAHANAIPVVVAVRAKDCAACGAQEQALDELLAMPTYQHFIRFRADFDAQKDVMEKLNVTERGTVIVYICNDEMGRVIDNADKHAIQQLFDKALVA